MTIVWKMEKTFLSFPLSFPVVLLSLCGKSHKNFFISSKKLRPILGHCGSEIVDINIII